MSTTFSNCTSLQETSVCLISGEFNHDCIDNLPSSVTLTWTIITVINGIAIPPTIFINFCVICTILSNCNHRSVRYNLLIAALASTDLLVGVILEPAGIWYRVCLIVVCKCRCTLLTVYTILGIILACLAFCSLVFVTFERYLAIEHTIFYIRNVTTKSMITSLAVIWICVPTAFALSKALLDHSRLLRMIPTVVIGIPGLVVLLFCLYRVQLTAFRQRRAIATQLASVQQTKEQKHRLQEYKRNCVMTLLVFASFIFYCPLIIRAILESVGGEDITEDFKYISLPVCMTFVHLQSLVNPVMSLRLSHIRNGVKRKLCFWRPLKTNHVEPTSLPRFHSKILHKQNSTSFSV